MSRPKGKALSWLNRPGVKDALANGISLTQVAKLADVSRQAVEQYVGRHLKPALALATKAQCFDILAAQNAPLPTENAASKQLANAALLAGPLLERITKRYEDVDELVPKAKRKKDFRGFAALASTEARYMELQADLTGLRNQAGQQNTLNVVLLLPQTHVADQAETIEAVVIDDESTN